MRSLLSCLLVLQSVCRQWTHPSTDRRSDARVVREVVITMQPAEASTMQCNHSVGGSHSAKRGLPLVGLDAYGEPRHCSVSWGHKTVMETDPRGEVLLGLRLLDD